MADTSGTTTKTVCGLVNLTVRCNQDCLFCCDGGDKKSGYHLSTEEALQHIRAVRERGASSVTLIGGEPLVRKDIVEIVAFASSIGLRVGLTSNGTALTKGLLDRLVRSGLTSIEISVHAFDPDLSRAISRRSFTPERQARALAVLADMTRDRPGVSINFVLFSKNWQELPKVVETVADQYAFVDELFINFVDPVGYPARDHGLVPRYSEIGPTLRKSLDLARSRTLRFTVDSVPGCILGPYFLFLRATREKLRGVLYAKDTLGVVTNDPDADVSQYYRVPACSSCAIRTLCPGVNFRYLAIHGDSEFSPVTRQTVQSMDVAIPPDLHGLDVLRCLADSSPPKPAPELGTNGFGARISRVPPPGGQGPERSYGPEDGVAGLGASPRASPDLCLSVSSRSNNRFLLAPDEAPASVEPTAGEVARFLSGYKAARVFVCGGEPTLRADLAVLVKSASRLGHRVVLCTNGRRFAYAEYAAGLRNAGLSSARVLLHSAVAEVHDAMVGAASHAQTVQGLRSLRTLGVEVTVEVVVTEMNVSGLRSLVELCRAEGCGVHFVPAPMDPSAAAQAIADAIEFGLGLGIDRSRLSFERLGCCLMESCKGMELRSVDDLPEMSGRPRPPRPMPAPCLRCELADHCSVLPPGLIERFGASALKPIGAAHSHDLIFSPSGTIPWFDPARCPHAAAGVGSPVEALVDRSGSRRSGGGRPTEGEGLAEERELGGGGRRPDGAAEASGRHLELWRVDPETGGPGAPLPRPRIVEVLAAKNARGFVRVPGEDGRPGAVLNLHPACRKCLRLHKCAGVFSASFDREKETAGFASTWRKRRRGEGAGGEIFREGPERTDAGAASTDAGTSIIESGMNSGLQQMKVRLSNIENIDSWLDAFVESAKPGERAIIRSRFPSAWLGRTDEAAGAPAMPWWIVDRAKGRKVALRSYDLDGAERGAWSLEIERTREVPPDWFYERLGTVFILSECPSRCIMCSVRKLYEEKLTPLPTIYRVLEEFRLCGYTRIDYFGGEPTVRDDLPDIIGYATSLDCYSDIITNGMPMTREVAARLADAGLSLAMVSVDGPDGATHDAIRGVPGAYEKALAGLGAILEQPGVEVNIDTVILPQNYKLMAKQAELAAKLRATHVNFFFCVCGPIAAPTPMWLSQEQLTEFHRDVLPRIRDIAKKAGITFTLSPDLPDERAEEHIARISSGTYNPFFETPETCAGPLDEIYVTLQGDVFPCTSPTILETSHVVGNIFEKSLIEILSDQPMREFAKVAGHVDACRMCFRCHVEPRIERRFEDARKKLKDRAGAPLPPRERRDSE